MLSLTLALNLNESIFDDVHCSLDSLFSTALSAMYPDLYEALHFLSFRTSFLVLFYSMDSKIQVVSQVRTYSIRMHCTHTYDAPQFKRYDSCFHPQSYKRRSNEIIPCCTTLLYYSFLLTDIDRYNIHTFELHQRGENLALSLCECEFEFIATNCKSLSTVTFIGISIPTVTGCYFELQRRKWHEVCYLIIKTNETNETNVKLVIYF